MNFKTRLAIRRKQQAEQATVTINGKQKVKRNGKKKSKKKSRAKK